MALRGLVKMPSLADVCFLLELALAVGWFVVFCAVLEVAKGNGRILLVLLLPHLWRYVPHIALIGLCTLLTRSFLRNTNEEYMAQRSQPLSKQDEEFQKEGGEEAARLSSQPDPEEYSVRGSPAQKTVGFAARTNLVRTTAPRYTETRRIEFFSEDGDPVEPPWFWKKFLDIEPGWVVVYYHSLKAWGPTPRKKFEARLEAERRIAEGIPEEPTSSPEEDEEAYGKALASLRGEDLSPVERQIREEDECIMRLPAECMGELGVFLRNYLFRLQDWLYVVDTQYDGPVAIDVRHGTWRKYLGPMPEKLGMRPEFYANIQAEAQHSIQMPAIEAGHTKRKRSASQAELNVPSDPVSGQHSTIQSIATAPSNDIRDTGAVGFGAPQNVSAFVHIEPLASKFTITDSCQGESATLDLATQAAFPWKYSSRKTTVANKKGYVAIPVCSAPSSTIGIKKPGTKSSRKPKKASRKLARPMKKANKESSRPLSTPLPVQPANNHYFSHSPAASLAEQPWDNQSFSGPSAPHYASNEKSTAGNAATTTPKAKSANGPSNLNITSTPLPGLQPQSNTSSAPSGLQAPSTPQQPSQSGSALTQNRSEGNISALTEEEANRALIASVAGDYSIITNAPKPKPSAKGVKPMNPLLKATSPGKVVKSIQTMLGPLEQTFSDFFDQELWMLELNGEFVKACGSVRRCMANIVEGGTRADGHWDEERLSRKIARKGGIKGPFFMKLLEFFNYLSSKEDRFFERNFAGKHYIVATRDAIAEVDAKFPAPVAKNQFAKYLSSHKDMALAIYGRLMKLKDLRSFKTLNSNLGRRFIERQDFKDDCFFLRTFMEDFYGIAAPNGFWDESRVPKNTMDALAMTSNHAYMMVRMIFEQLAQRSDLKNLDHVKGTWEAIETFDREMLNFMGHTEVPQQDDTAKAILMNGTEKQDSIEQGASSAQPIESQAAVKDGIKQQNRQKQSQQNEQAAVSTQSVAQEVRMNVDEKMERKEPKSATATKRKPPPRKPRMTTAITQSNSSTSAVMEIDGDAKQNKPETASQTSQSRSFDPARPSSDPVASHSDSMDSDEKTHLRPSSGNGNAPEVSKSANSTQPQQSVSSLGTQANKIHLPGLGPKPKQSSEPTVQEKADSPMEDAPSKEVKSSTTQSSSEPTPSAQTQAQAQPASASTDLDTQMTDSAGNDNAPTQSSSTPAATQLSSQQLLPAFGTIAMPDVQMSSSSGSGSGLFSIQAPALTPAPAPAAPAAAAPQPPPAAAQQPNPPTAVPTTVDRFSQCTTKKARLALLTAGLSTSTFITYFKNLNYQAPATHYTTQEFQDNSKELREFFEDLHQYLVRNDGKWDFSLITETEADKAGYHRGVYKRVLNEWINLNKAHGDTNQSIKDTMAAVEAVKAAWMKGRTPGA